MQIESNFKVLFELDPSRIEVLSNKNEVFIIDKKLKFLLIIKNKRCLKPELMIPGISFSYGFLVAMMYK